MSKKRREIDILFNMLIFDEPIDKRFLSDIKGSAIIDEIKEFEGDVKEKLENQKNKINEIEENIEVLTTKDFNKKNPAPNKSDFESEEEFLQAKKEYDEALNLQINRIKEQLGIEKAKIMEKQEKEEDTSDRISEVTEVNPQKVFKSISTNKLKNISKKINELDNTEINILETKLQNSISGSKSTKLKEKRKDVLSLLEYEKNRRINFNTENIPQPIELKSDFLKKYLITPPQIIKSEEKLLNKESKLIETLLNSGLPYLDMLNIINEIERKIDKLLITDSDNTNDIKTKVTEYKKITGLELSNPKAEKKLRNVSNMKRDYTKKLQDFIGLSQSPSSKRNRGMIVKSLPSGSPIVVPKEKGLVIKEEDVDIEQFFKDE